MTTRPPAQSAPGASRDRWRQDAHGIDLWSVWDQIDRQGWDGAAGRELLEYVRVAIVRPQVRRSGVTGLAAAQADATGWEVAWEVLAGAQIRTAGNPWAVLRTAVARAVRGEVVSALYASSVRRSWEYYATYAPVCSIDVTVLDRASDPLVVTSTTPPAMTAIVTALREVGWSERDVAMVISWLAAHPGADASRVGWRRLAARSGLPAWRVRRLCRLLLGVDGRPGLVEAVTTGGPSKLRTRSVQCAMRATTRCSYRSAAITIALADVA